MKWILTVDFQTFAVDLVRLIHVFAIACGLGGAIVADLFTLRTLQKPITAQTIQFIKFFHWLITLALIPLWVSGLMLVHIKTGFDPANVTPKLAFKLLVVFILTSNGLILGPAAISILNANRGNRIVELEPKQLLFFAIFGATSATCWLLALSFGIIKFLATSGPELLTILTATVWTLSFAGISSGLLLIRYWTNGKQTNGWLATITFSTHRP